MATAWPCRVSGLVAVHGTLVTLVRDRLRRIAQLSLEEGRVAMDDILLR